MNVGHRSLAVRGLAIAITALVLSGCASGETARRVLICHTGLYAPDKGSPLPVLICREPDARGYVPELE